MILNIWVAKGAFKGRLFPISARIPSRVFGALRVNGAAFLSQSRRTAAEGPKSLSFIRLSFKK
jgi:hypothetical protein